MNKIILSVLAIGLSVGAFAQTIISDDFEGMNEFEINPAGATGWTYVDGDESTTYGFSGIAFENSGEAMAFICFDPTLTDPELTSITPHSGTKFLASFAATTPPNDDWLISPVLQGTTAYTLTLWAKSFMDTYGLERMKVLYSTTTNETSAFTKINTGNYIAVPAGNWTEYTFTLPQGTKYFAIQCVSNDAFILLLDDITLTSATTGLNDIANLNNAVVAYPNPAKDILTLNSSVNMNRIEIYNVLGQKVFEAEQGGFSTEINIENFAAGNYVARIFVEGGVATKNVVIK